MSEEYKEPPLWVWLASSLVLYAFLWWLGHAGHFNIKLPPWL